MPANGYRGPPMTLANMRPNGVRSIAVYCWTCHHEAVLNADCWPAALGRMIVTALLIILRQPTIRCDFR
jgi:hypothetical protein